APFRAATPEAAIAAARRRGIKLAKHKAQRATHAMVAEADLVVVMDESQQRVAREYFGAARRSIVLLGDCDPEPIECREIPDPINASAAEFDACYARIERCVATLAGILLAAADETTAEVSS